MSNFGNDEPATQTFELLDVIQLMVDRPDLGLVAGDRGTVVHVFPHTSDAYEIEFVDETGRTRSMGPVKTKDMIIIWKYGRRPDSGERSP